MQSYFILILYPVFIIFLTLFSTFFKKYSPLFQLVIFRIVLNVIYCLH